MKSKSGFTLVELLVVILVIAILAAITVVAYNGIQDRARDAAVASDMHNLSEGIAIYQDTQSNTIDETTLNDSTNELNKFTNNVYENWNDAILYIPYYPASAGKYAVAAVSASGHAYILGSSGSLTQSATPWSSTADSDAIWNYFYNNHPELGVQVSCDGYFQRTPTGSWQHVMVGC